MRSPETGIPSISINVDAAKAYVLAHGSEREQARLEGLFGRRQPERAVVKQLEQLQNPDGGFPLRQQPGGPSSVDTTCFVLAQLKEIPPLAGSPMASRALAFLRRMQQTDGSWSESPEVTELAPQWAQVTNPLATAYLTANATYTLQTMEPEHLDPIRRASKWLRQELGRPSAGEQAYSQSLFLSAAVWGQVLGPAAAEPAWAYELLTHRELSAVELAWWLTTFVALGVEARFFPLTYRLLAQLATLQGADGAWPGEAGAEVESTLAALRVFRGFRLI